MPTRLAEQAVRYYIKHPPYIILVFEDSMLKNSFIPVFIKEDLVYLHSSSIISFCHRFAPDVFKELTQTMFCSAFLDTYVIIRDGSSVQFRVITLQQFKELVK